MKVTVYDAEALGGESMLDFEVDAIDFGDRRIYADDCPIRWRHGSELKDPRRTLYISTRAVSCVLVEHAAKADIQVRIRVASTEVNRAIDEALGRSAGDDC